MRYIYLKGKKVENKTYKSLCSLKVQLTKFISPNFYSPPPPPLANNFFIICIKIVVWSGYHEFVAIVGGDRGKNISKV